MGNYRVNRMMLTDRTDQIGDSRPLVRAFKARVLGQRQLSPTAFELTLERNELAFRAGQLITIHGRDVTEDRQYSIASGESDDTLQILYRLIPSGVLTPRLVKLKIGDVVEISGPYGEFVLRDRRRPIVFVATGTGIAPCRAFFRSYPDIDLTVLHGVRTLDDLFYREEFSRCVYHPCVSADERAPIRGRVTDFSRGYRFPDGAHFYLCGANEMFYEMREILLERGVPAEAVFTEAYYYRHDD